MMIVKINKERRCSEEGDTCTHTLTHTHKYTHRHEHTHTHTHVRAQGGEKQALDKATPACLSTSVLVALSLFPAQALALSLGVCGCEAQINRLRKIICKLISSTSVKPQRHMPYSAFCNCNCIYICTCTAYYLN